MAARCKSSYFSRSRAHAGRLPAFPGEMCALCVLAKLLTFEFRARRTASFMSRILIVLSFILNSVAVFATVWIIFPALSYELWLVSVLASEWSLGFAALALIGIAFAVLARAFGAKRLWLVSLLIGATAILIALYPVASAFSAARAHNVLLSATQYLRGFWNNQSSPEKVADEFTTRTFANVDGVELRLDVYAPPAEIVNKNAAIVIVHGGSWSGGARNDFPNWNRWLAGQGYTVFDADYRLAPQPNWQTATGDVKCAVLWIKQHAQEFDIAPAKIALVGRSAGGHLALLAAYAANDQRLPASCPAGEFTATVRAVAAFYAPTDLLWAYDNPANKFVINGPATLAKFVGGSPHESAEVRERFWLASPIAHVSPTAAPTLLIHGGQDQLVRDENLTRLAQRLAESKVPHKTVQIAAAQHGFDYNFNGFGAQIVQPVLLEFLDENLK